MLLPFSLSFPNPIKHMHVYNVAMNKLKGKQLELLMELAQIREMSGMEFNRDPITLISTARNM